ncbi:hypothetical protein L484_021259 [Morus notabilis]|uniref:Uncharacterized protein n=1 Tax=Morus notabilis TaxID=981085 RepID=W9RT97_9ROSA|nr:hypothetical protein L484_021259 [Morus notabilis]
MAKDYFTTNDKFFANRPKAVALEHMAYNYAMFGFSSYGSYWRHLRKIATLELLSSHRLQMLSHIRKIGGEGGHKGYMKNGIRTSCKSGYEKVVWALNPKHEA